MGKIFELTWKCHKIIIINISAHAHQIMVEVFAFHWISTLGNPFGTACWTKSYNGPSSLFFTSNRKGANTQFYVFAIFDGISARHVSINGIVTTTQYVFFLLIFACSLMLTTERSVRVLPICNNNKFQKAK